MSVDSLHFNDDALCGHVDCSQIDNGKSSHLTTLFVVVIVVVVVVSIDDDDGHRQISMMIPSVNVVVDFSHRSDGSFGQVYCSQSLAGTSSHFVIIVVVVVLDEDVEPPMQEQTIAPLICVLTHFCDVDGHNVDSQDSIGVLLQVSDDVVVVVVVVVVSSSLSMQLHAVPAAFTTHFNPLIGQMELAQFDGKVDSQFVVIVDVVDVDVGDGVKLSTH